MPKVTVWPCASRLWFAGCALAFVCLVAAGCGGATAGVAEPDAKAKLERLFRLYKAYVEKNRKAPSDEQALRDFGQKLTAEERAAHLIGDDVENLFTSSRDKQKFVVRYNMMPNPSGSKAVAWEAEGQGGNHFVALERGYVEEYSGQMFQDATK